jgi:hypothetical protein
MGEAASHSGNVTERQRQAFLTLLGDDDPETYRTVRARILALGPSVGDWLKPHLVSRRPTPSSWASACRAARS